MLQGGHPNSLGRTLEVAKIVLSDRNQLQELYRCYQSEDETVRYRVSNVFKKVFREKGDWFGDYVDNFQELIPKLQQPSAEWTLAQLHLELEDCLSEIQRIRAIEITKNQLENSNDWLVIIKSINLLEHWSKDDNSMKNWLVAKLESLNSDSRRSIRRRTEKAAKALSAC